MLVQHAHRIEQYPHATRTHTHLHPSHYNVCALVRACMCSCMCEQLTGYVKPDLPTLFRCPERTFNPGVRKTSFSDCQACPSGAVTDGDAQISKDACVCPIRTYNIGVECKTCPLGAECTDRTKGCGLRSPRPCTLVGDWVQEGTSPFRLMGCPTGYKLSNASGEI